MTDIVNEYILISVRNTEHRGRRYPVGKGFMKKNDIDNLIQSMKRQKTDVLVNKSKDLQNIIDERAITKSMYFWSPSRDASGRRGNEKRRNIEIAVKLTSSLIVTYKRYYRESCNYVYASDELVCSDENMSFSVTDAKKIIERINGVLEKRAGNQ